MAILEANRKKSWEDKKFMAQLQGVNLDDANEDPEDLASLKGVHADQAGFGIGLGIGYTVEGE